MEDSLRIYYNDAKIFLLTLEYEPLFLKVTKYSQRIFKSLQNDLGWNLMKISSRLSSKPIIIGILTSSTNIIKILFMCQKSTHFASFHRAEPRKNGFNFSAKSSIFVVAKPTKIHFEKSWYWVLWNVNEKLDKRSNLKSVSRKCRVVKRHKLCLVLTLE